MTLKDFFHRKSQLAHPRYSVELDAEAAGCGGHGCVRTVESVAGSQAVAAAAARLRGGPVCCGRSVDQIVLRCGPIWVAPVLGQPSFERSL